MIKKASPNETDNTRKLFPKTDTFPKSGNTIKNEQLTVNTFLQGDIVVSMYRGILTIDLTKNKPPVIVTLQPGIPSSPGMGNIINTELNKILKGGTAAQ